MNTDGRVIVWFSCGAASACAAKLALAKYPEARIVYCNTLASEHPDNVRFFSQVEKWLGRHIEIITSKKFNTIDDVFEKERYMSGIAGAPCTRVMKKIPRLDYQLPNDLHIFGLTSDEQGRIRRFEANNPDLEVEWVLSETGLTKEACCDMIFAAGIALPVMYALGFNNNNCLGCVKATSPKYWERVRAHFPEVFKKRCEQSRAIGCRLVRLHGKRIFLDELPEIVTDRTAEEDIECGVFCVKEDLVQLDPAQKSHLTGR